ncbi:hypothetical protein QOZ80_2BG0186010 [Eleusine coracana subsp. coracana]|nr:hypothetical protein QOZ80_2BG0186010 [Eleusine coracana subsp. coracana]
MGIGIVARDHRGDFLAACRQGVDKVTNPEMAEAIALRRSVGFASQLPYNQVIVATDCLSLFHKIQSEAVDRSHTGIITQDIKEAARVSPVIFSFTHVSRWCNEVAHVLAKSADQVSESVWLDVPPDLIWSALCNDRFNQ